MEGTRSKNKKNLIAMLSENKDTSPLVREAFPMTKLPGGSLFS